MPRGDRTGPIGQGPRTGRALGLCSGYPTPGFMQRTTGMAFGRGLAWHRGFGFARRYGSGWGIGPWNYEPPYPVAYSENEREALKRQAEVLKKQQAEIDRRIAELEKSE